MRGNLYNRVSVGDRIYVAGSVIEDSHGKYYVDRYTSIVSDGVSLYIGGMAYSNADRYGGRVWVIEKRDLSGETVGRKIVDLRPSSKVFLYDMSVDPVTGNLWIAGSSRDYSLIVVLDKNLNETTRIAYSRSFGNYFGNSYSICFDSAGFTYVSGSMV